MKLTVAPRLDNREHGSRVSVVVPSGWPARVRSVASRTSGLRSGREGHANAFGGRGDEGLAFGTQETQGVRQRAHGVRMGSLPLAALERAYGFSRQTGPRSQPFLRQLGGLARAPEARRSPWSSLRS